MTLQVDCSVPLFLNYHFVSFFGNKFRITNGRWLGASCRRAHSYFSKIFRNFPQIYLFDDTFVVCFDKDPAARTLGQSWAIFSDPIWFCVESSKSLLVWESIYLVPVLSVRVRRRPPCPECSGAELVADAVDRPLCPPPPPPTVPSERKNKEYLCFFPRLSRFRCPDGPFSVPSLSPIKPKTIDVHVEDEGKTLSMSLARVNPAKKGYMVASILRIENRGNTCQRM